jgi:hypothetical protein
MEGAVVDTARVGRATEAGRAERTRARASEIAAEGERPEGVEMEEGVELTDGSLVIVGDWDRSTQCDNQPNVSTKTKIKMDTERSCTALDQGDDNRSPMSTSQIGIAQTMEVVSSDKFTVAMALLSAASRDGDGGG